MAKRKHPETGEEVEEPKSEDLEAYEASQKEQAEAAESKKEEEEKAAEDMAEQQKDAAEEAKKHGNALAAARARGSVRPKQILTVKGELISTDPEDLDQYEGEYVSADDNEKYGLKLVPDDPNGHTHHLKNVDHFWSGTAEEFKKKFEKE